MTWTEVRDLVFPNRTSTARTRSCLPLWHKSMIAARLLLFATAVMHHWMRSTTV